MGKAGWRFPPLRAKQQRDAKRWLSAAIKGETMLVSHHASARPVDAGGYRLPHRNNLPSKSGRRSGDNDGIAKAGLNRGDRAISLAFHKSDTLTRAVETDPRQACVVLKVRWK